MNSNPKRSAILFLSVLTLLNPSRAKSDGDVCQNNVNDLVPFLSGDKPRVKVSVTKDLERDQDTEDGKLNFYTDWSNSGEVDKSGDFPTSVFSMIESTKMRIDPKLEGVFESIDIHKSSGIVELTISNAGFPLTRVKCRRALTQNAKVTESIETVAQLKQCLDNNPSVKITWPKELADCKVPKSTLSEKLSKSLSKLNEVDGPGKTSLNGKESDLFIKGITIPTAPSTLTAPYDCTKDAGNINEEKGMSPDDVMIQRCHHQ